MKIEDQVVSLKLAEKLKELGVEQVSLYQWLNGVLVDFKKREEARFDNYAHSTKNIFYAAFTVAELGEVLPGNTSGLYFVTQKGLMGNSWYVDALTVVGHSKVCLTTAETEADARAKMLIHLIENKLITL